MENSLPRCSVCHQEILETYYFCPNCGNNLKEAIAPVSVITQISLYILAILLPPLGLWPGIKYLMKKNRQAKTIGTVVIVLTIISIIVVTWAIFGLFNDYINQLNEVLGTF